MSIKTKVQLKTEADANITTNGVRSNTGAKHNAMLTNTFDSVVSIIDAETINGVKTFGSFPVTPSSAPTTDYQVANKKYIDDKLPFKVYKAEVSLTNIQVGALGVTPQTVITSGGANTYINVLSAYAKFTVTTALEVGTQDLNLAYDQSIITADLRVLNTQVEHGSGGAEYLYKFRDSDSITSPDVYREIEENKDMIVYFSSGANPSSGSATIDITILYTIETY